MGQPTKFILTEPEARGLTEAIRRNVEDTWRLLTQARDGQAWKVLGYQSFEAYVGSEFGISRSRAYQLLDHTRITEELEAAVAQPADPPVGSSRRPESVHIVDSEAESRRLKPILPKVIEKVRQETAVVPPAERRGRAREVVRTHLAKAAPPPPVQQVLNLYPPPQTAEQVRLVAARVVEQTADRLAHCCSADQLRDLADRAQAAWALAAEKSVGEAGRCPQCNGLTGSIGGGKIGCRNRGCDWTGKAAG